MRMGSAMQLYLGNVAAEPRGDEAESDLFRTSVGSWSSRLAMRRVASCVFGLLLALREPRLGGGDGAGAAWASLMIRDRSMVS